VKRAFPLFVTACATHATMPYATDVAHTLATPPSARQVAAPEKLDRKPWKIGQWALYRQDVGYRRISLVGEDGCGLWFEDVSERPDHRFTQWICMRAPTGPAAAPELLQVVITRWDAANPQIHDFRQRGSTPISPLFTDAAWGLYRQTWLDRPDVSREDIDVPAGHFASAARGVDQQGATVWFHPDVPFDGTVKSITRTGGELVLVAYGDDDRRSALPELAERPPPRLPRTFGVLGIGIGLLTGTASEQLTSGPALSARVGFHARRDVDVVLALDLVFQERYSPDATIAQSSAVVVLGARWFPYRSSGVFARADIGLAMIGRSPASGPSTTAHAFALGGALGWRPFPWRVYGASIELADRIGFFGSDGPRHNVMLGVAYELP
jgi:hypothetical protein